MNIVSYLVFFQCLKDVSGWEYSGKIWNNFYFNFYYKNWKKYVYFSRFLPEKSIKGKNKFNVIIYFIVNDMYSSKSTNTSID